MITPFRSDSSIDEVSRLHDLACALVRLQEVVPGLSVDEPGCLTGTGQVVEPEKGVAVTYRPPGAAAEVALLVSYRRVKLVTRTLDRGDAWTELEDRLIIALDGEPTLLGRRFDSVEELARALVALAERRASDAVLTERALGVRRAAGRAVPDGVGILRPLPDLTGPAERSP